MTEPVGILNWRRLDDRVTTSGQPSEEQLAALANLGIERIVNLGLHSHARALPDEAHTVTELGMAYTHIPVDFAAPTEDDYRRFRAVMTDSADSAVHVHCILNARVTAFFYRYRQDVLGDSEADARAMMESVWRPGGVWAAFIGDDAAAERDHEFAGRDY